MLEFNRIKKGIERCSIISFDLFDTLIKRDCYKPAELFCFIERKIDQEYGVKSWFASARVQAEIAARNKSKAEEVSLDEIYNELSLPFSSVSKEQIKQLEEEYEYESCQWNPLMKPVYEYCRNQGKRIFIITDIYLPEALIKRILRKLEIQYEALFVSSTLKKMKRNGTLFREVLKLTGNHPSDILHIGDNRQSDYDMPKKLGIRAVHISKSEGLNLFINWKLYKADSEYADLCSFINNHADTHSWDAVHTKNTFDFFSESGYEAQGPVLYGYVNWLQEQFKEDGIEKAFFLARDGQLMQKAYRKLSHFVPNEYMYASRKALIIPSLWLTPSIQEIHESIYWGKYGTVSSFLKKIGLEPAEFENYYMDVGISLNKVYKYKDLWKHPAFLAVYENHIKQDMISHSHKAYDLLLRYLQQLNFSGKVAVVDIGWFGHMQGALERIVKEAHLPVEIHGYYLGLRPGSSMLDHIQAKGYLFDRNHNQDLSKKEGLLNSIVEMLFTADHGTTNGYIEEGENIRPSLGKWEYCESAKEDFEAIQACQKGALAFIDDWLKVKDNLPFTADSAVAFANWLEFGSHPSSRTAVLFGNLHFMDETVAYLAKPEKHGYAYLFQPQAFLRELRNTFWQRGFWVRTLGTDIPLADGYNKVRKLYSMLKK